MKQKPAIHGRDHRIGGEDPIPMDFACYDTTLTNVSNTTTPTTFLSFTVPANDMDLGSILYVQWYWGGANQSGGDVQPTITLVWGTSFADWGFLPFTLSTGDLAPWTSDPAPPPTVGFNNSWAITLQRVGDTADPTSEDGKAAVFDPNGWTPLFQPFLEPRSFPSFPTWDLDFTKDQLVEFQISWDVADTTVAFDPVAASAVRWC